MTAADRSVPVRRFAATVDQMVEELAKQPVFDNDVPWTYEVEADGLNFFENGVLVEQWRQK